MNIYEINAILETSLRDSVLSNFARIRLYSCYYIVNNMNIYF